MNRLPCNLQHLPRFWALQKLWGAGWGRTGIANSDKGNAAASYHPRVLQQFKGPLLDIAK